MGGYGVIPDTYHGQTPRQPFEPDRSPEGVQSGGLIADRPQQGEHFCILPGDRDLQRAERGKIAAFAGVKVGLRVVEAHRASRRRREFRALIDEEAGNPVRPMKRREHQDALRTDDLPASFSTAPQALLQGSGVIRPDGFGDGGALTRRPRLQHLLQPEPCQACQKGDGRDGLNSEYDGQPPPPFTAPTEEIDQPRQQVACPDEQDSERQTEVGEKAAAVVLQDQRPTAKQASGHEECGEAQEPEVGSFSRCTTSHGPGHDSFDAASSKRKEPLPCDGEVDLWPFLAAQRAVRGSRWCRPVPPGLRAEWTCNPE